MMLKRDNRGVIVYHTTAKKLLQAYQIFKANPQARVTTGIWSEECWSREDFTRWFIRCLHAKINRSDTRKGRRLTEDYQLDQWLDSRIIADYSQRIRHCGCSLLRTPELHKRYPEVDNQVREDSK